MLRKLLANVWNQVVGRAYKEGDKVFLSGEFNSKGSTNETHLDCTGYTIVKLGAADKVQVRRVIDGKLGMVSINNLKHAAL